MENMREDELQREYELIRRDGLVGTFGMKDVDKLLDKMGYRFNGGGS